SMNHGIEVILPVGQACGTNALLPPTLWTSSAENSCRAAVFATAATQSRLSSTTSGALAPVSEEGRLEIFVALTSMSGCAMWKAFAASCAPVDTYQKLIVVAALGAFAGPPHAAVRSRATAPDASHLIMSVTRIVTGPCAGGVQSLGVAGHQRVGRSASTGRESTPQRTATIASRIKSRTAMRTSMDLVFPSGISE